MKLLEILIKKMNRNLLVKEPNSKKGLLISSPSDKNKTQIWKLADLQIFTTIIVRISNRKLFALKRLNSLKTNWRSISIKKQNKMAFMKNLIGFWIKWCLKKWRNWENSMRKMISIKFLQEQTNQDQNLDQEQLHHILLQEILTYKLWNRIKKVKKFQKVFLLLGNQLVFHFLNSMNKINCK
jgi:hypothetical protein